MMKKHWKAIGSGIVCVVVLLAVVFTFLSTHPLVEDEQDKSVQTAALPDYDAKENYIVLEIVPDSCYKQLSYLEAGNEPVDIFKVSNDGNADKIAAVAGNGVQLVKEINGIQYKQLVEIYGEDKVKKNFVQTVTGGSVDAKQSKYELKASTADVKKSFPLNKNILVDKFSSLIYGKGVEDMQVVSVTSDDLNSADIGKVKSLISAADVIVMNQSFAAGAEAEQEALKDYVPGSKGGKKFVENDLNWDVTNALFERLSSKKNPVTIFMDSSIYQNALDKSDVSVNTVQYKLNREVKYKDGKFKKDYTVVGEDGLFNKTSFQAGNGKKASNNNAYKLFLMSMFRDPIEFQNLFVESGLIKENGKNYQLQEGNAAEYWNAYTFLPCTGDLASDIDSNGVVEFKEADTDYWTKKMGITLGMDADSRNYINCNVVSFDASKKSLISGLSGKESYKISGKSATKDYTLLDIMSLLEDYTPKANVSGKEYKVLELQPAKGFDLSPVAIERMIPYTSYSSSSSISLQITKMTTAEFIGRTDDLTSCYDMIYIGRNATGLPHDSTGKKVYYGANNSDMDGVLYAHLGAKVNFNYGTPKDTSSASNSNSNGHAFFMKRVNDSTPPKVVKEDSGCLRYSGNDITELKKKELEVYLGTELPIVVASGLCEDAAKAKPDYFNFPEYNNMRNFLKSKKDELMNLQFNYRTASAKELETQLTRLTKVKPTLTVTGMHAANNSYTGSELDKTVKFEFESTSADRKITFNYKIEDEDAGNAYTIELYVDKNADGRFVSKERVGKRSASSGSEQSFSFNMNTNYRGAFTWKLVAYPNSNKTLICSQIGYGTIKFTDVTGGKKVKVLQVQAVAGAVGSKHSVTWGRDKAQQIQLNDKVFTKLFDEIRSDYDISIDLITLQEFTWGPEGSKNANGKWTGTDGKVHTRKDLLDASLGYDMIVFGFADSYRDMEFNNSDIATDIDNYIASGRSVLFTHDLTSQINDESIFSEANAAEDGTKMMMETTNGKGFNKYMRDRMGLNRFDQDVRVGTNKASANYDSMSAVGRDVTDKYGFTYTALMQYSNFRHGWSNPGNSAKEKGFYGPYENLFVGLGTSSQKGPNLAFPDIFNGNGGQSETKPTYGTSRITNVNNGQITSYPFDLSSLDSAAGVLGDGKYKIGLTHGQYYQLNMEDEEIVCWYALNDKNTAGEGWYSSSPNDVANNYYIYNKGNVTYTGVGHSTAAEMSIFERKLFVNTIVAALRAGVEGPGATITNGFNVPENGNDRYVVYADVDADSDAVDFNGKEDVEFYVTDEGTEEKKMYVAIEWNDNGETDENGKLVYREKTAEQLAAMGIELKAASGSTAPVVVDYTRQVGGENDPHNKIFMVDKTDETGTDVKGYTLKIPRSFLQNQSSQEFRIVVYEKYDSTKNTGGAMGYTNAAVLRRPLFKLD